ncbi:hypothetical protein [Pseudarthrobacter sp. MEB009]|uniref:MmyB family transcriptional regulator n=1 Tax=Pseudarthrobacter sp. MEB009 TaxID=3040326 RepID=UPI002555495F|nr:hypothetical protein [Pseudarthrobacter sp. MEB009]
MLAGMSVDYYNRLERGNLTGVSDSILGSLARALYHPNGDEPEQPQNFARFLFLDPAAPGQVVDWEPMAQDIVAILRQEAARDPHNRDLTDLIGELSTQSEDFRSMWAAQNVRLHGSGTKSFQHTVVGAFICWSRRSLCPKISRLMPLRPMRRWLCSIQRCLPSRRRLLPESPVTWQALRANSASPNAP